MGKIAIDTPKYITDMLEAVDFSRITDAQYSEWSKIIAEQLGKHIKKRSVLVMTKTLDYPVKQGFLDIINAYDFNTLPKLKQIMAIPLAKNWANNNLPLTKKIK
jgi:hypothetical protein